MSAHDDAMRVVVHDFSPHDPWELEQIVKAYLSDLPPSTVVADLLDAARRVAEGEA